MGRLPKAIQQAVSLERVNPNVAFTNNPNMLASIANTADNLSSAMLNKRNEIQAIEEEKQSMLSTIKMNEAHAEMSRRVQALRNDVEKKYADNPNEGHQHFVTEVSRIKQEYDDRFSDDLYSQSRWSGISESVNGEALTTIDSWKSSQEIVNATKSYRNTQELRIQAAGDANNLAELYKVYRDSNTDFEASKGILASTNFDASADHKDQLGNITKEFLNGQIDRAPGTIEAYLKDPMIEHHLTESEKNSYKDLAKAEIKSKKEEAEESDAIDNLFDYYDTYSAAKDGKVTVGQINAKIESLRKSKAPAGRIEQWLQLREMVHGQNVAASNKAQEEIDKALTEEAKAKREAELKVSKNRALIDVTTRYNKLFFDKNGNPVTSKVSIEETTKLLSDITKYQQQGLIGDVSSFQKNIITSINKELESGSKIYKTKKGKNPTGGILPNWLGMGDIDVPIDEYNKGLKTIIDFADKSYPDNGNGNGARDSVKALAVSDYITNYDRYKKMGMTDKEIRLDVFQSAQKTQRGEMQQTVDRIYQQQRIKREGGLTYYMQDYLPRLSKELGMTITVISGGGYRPGDPGMHGQKKAVDVSMSEHHKLKDRIKFFQKEVDNPAVKSLGTSDPQVIAYFAGNPKIKDLRKHDNETGDNHINHVHITLNQGGGTYGINSVVAKPGNSAHKFNSKNEFDSFIKKNKLADGAIVNIAGKEYTWRN